MAILELLVVWINRDQGYVASHELSNRIAIAAYGILQFTPLCFASVPHSGCLSSVLSAVEQTRETQMYRDGIIVWFKPWGKEDVAHRHYWTTGKLVHEYIV